MSINKWFFDFHLLEQGWQSTPPYREDGRKLRPPSASFVTVRMIEFGSDEKPDIWYKAEVDHIEPGIGKNCYELTTASSISSDKAGSSAATRARMRPPIKLA